MGGATGSRRRSGAPMPGPPRARGLDALARAVGGCAAAIGVLQSQRSKHVAARTALRRPPGVDADQRLAMPRAVAVPSARARGAAAAQALASSIAAPRAAPAAGLARARAPRQRRRAAGARASTFAGGERLARARARARELPHRPRAAPCARALLGTERRVARTTAAAAAGCRAQEPRRRARPRPSVARARRRRGSIALCRARRARCSAGSRAAGAAASLGRRGGAGRCGQGGEGLGERAAAALERAVRGGIARRRFAALARGGLVIEALARRLVEACGAGDGTRREVLSRWASSRSRMSGVRGLGAQRARHPLPQRRGSLLPRAPGPSRRYF